MDTESLIDLLENLTPDDYVYAGLVATFGPLVLRVLGFKRLAVLVRPLALLVLAGGFYAKQQRRFENGENTLGSRWM